MSPTAKLRPFDIESFLHLWERSIELSDPNRRSQMEAERDANWTSDEKLQTAARACTILASIARNADRTTELGSDLARSARSLIRAFRESSAYKETTSTA